MGRTILVSELFTDETLKKKKKKKKRGKNTYAVTVTKP